MPETVEDIFNKVKDGFNYKSDIQTQGVVEHWGESLDKLDGEWEGDCDDFAITCALLAEESGFKSENIRVIFCQVETGGYHLVCGIDTDDDTLILDNRQKFVVSAGELYEYKWMSGMNLNERGTWRKIT